MDLDEDSTNKEVIPLNQSQTVSANEEAGTFAQGRDAGKKPSRRVSKRSENATAPHRASS